MKISELISRLIELETEYGDLEVTYVDNGDFAEDWNELDPQVDTICRNGEIVNVVVL